MSRRKQSKYSIAGPSIAEFLEKPVWYAGCWAFLSTDNKNKFQRMLTASAHNRGIKLQTMSFSGLGEHDTPMICLRATIVEKGNSQ